MEEEGTPFHTNECPRLQKFIICGRKLLSRTVISNPHYTSIKVKIPCDLSCSELHNDTLHDIFGPSINMKRGCKVRKVNQNKN